MIRQFLVILIGLLFLLLAACGTEEPGANQALQNNEGEADLIANIGFEKWVADWEPVEGCTIEQSFEEAVKGKASLRIGGESPEGFWHYVRSPRIKLEPGENYLFSAWMKITALEQAEYPPRVSFSIYHGNKEWVVNVHTMPPDVTGLGKWQYFSASFSAPDIQSVYGHLVI